ncbi:MAG: hypothetical protein ACRBCK_01225 [Alphaproteobacteria bacterium]
MEPVTQNTILSHVHTSEQVGERGKSVSYVRNERMAGFVPSYDAKSTGRDFAQIVSAYDGVEPETIGTVENVPEDKSAFGFWDFVDMVNPLQHIPIVNYLYREITGDEIKPIGKIVGGGLYGGPIGAASGLMNAVIEDGTGKDIVGNAMRVVRHDQDIAVERAAYDDLPVTLLSMAETPIETKSSSDMPKIFFNS